MRMDIQEYIQPELLILVPVLYLIGIGLKKSAMADKWIPLVLGGVSVALSALWVFATCNYSGAREIAEAAFTAVTQGILIAGASVYVNQLIRQSGKQE